MYQILLLGGTQFVGRQLSERLLARGDVKLSLFHRGRTGADLFPEAEHILGDRETDAIAQITGRDWDAVLDFSGYFPGSLAQLLPQLSGRVGRYLFISSISAYDFERTQPGTLLTEDSPLLSCTPDQAVDPAMTTYGQRKAACERVLLEQRDLPTVSFRPGLIYGRYDPTDRFYAWLWRYQQRTRVLLPDMPAFRSQWTWADDFARLLEQALLGPLPARQAYHVLTHEPLAWGAVTAQLAQACGRQPEEYRVSAEWIQQQGLLWWQDLPLLLPEECLFERRALLQDFDWRDTPFSDSLHACQDWYASLDWPKPRYGMTPEREEALLQRLTAR
ncbi:MAG: NAD-dependent epimerase/dehydratase family protein [Candidatus Sericytochromatia bacterium]